jgi:hypothetical protein
MEPMTGRSWALLAFCALLLALRVAVELDSGGVRPAALGSKALATTADETVALLPDAPFEWAPADASEDPDAASGVAGEAVENSGGNARRPVFELGFDESVLEEFPEDGTRAPAAGAEPDAIPELEIEAAAQQAVAPRKHDGDLSRAALKTAHLRDRSRKALGGVHLRDLSTTADPGRRLGELPLGPHLRDRTRKDLGGGDLRDLVSSEPGNLGARNLKSGDLQSLSRRDDEYGDLADRSGR